MARPASSKSKPWKRNVLLGILTLGLIGSMAFGAFYFKKYQDLKKQPMSAAEVAEAETERIIREVSELYDVPKEEKPLVEIIKKEQLNEQFKDQPFFSGAEDGDAAVVYTKAQLAILYRPSTRKIIRVSNVSVQTPKASTVLIGAEADRKVVEATLKNLKNEVIISGRSDAESRYTQTVVIDLTGKNAELVKKLAAALKNAKVGDLPEDEEKPDNADIVIIAGSSPR